MTGDDQLPIETARLILRELDDGDADAASAWEADPEVVRYQSLEVRTRDETLEYIRRVRLESRVLPRRLFDLGVVRRDDGLLMGRVGLEVRRPEHREAELWFVLRRDAWRQGYAVEAARALLAVAFGPLDLHRVFGDCDPRNHASARLMERLGMRLEGHLRQNYFLKGEWCDSLIYGLLADEWRSRR